MAKRKGYKKRKGMSAEFLKNLRRKYHLGEFKTTSRHTLKTKRFIRSKKHIYSMARRHRYSRHRKGMGGMFSGINFGKILTYGAGAGLAGFAGGYVSKWTNSKLSGNMAEAVAGIGLVAAGKMARINIVKELGYGVLIKATGDFVEDNVVPKLQGLNTGTTNNNSGEVV